VLIDSKSMEFMQLRRTVNDLNRSCMNITQSFSHRDVV